MEIKIGLIGFGTVGQGLCEILLNKKNELKKKYNFHYSIVSISDMKYGTIHNSKGLDINNVLFEVKADGKFLSNRVKWSPTQMIKKSGADVICELAYTNLNDGQPAIEHCRTSLKNGKHLVTSNKGPAALAYHELRKLADNNGVKFMIEGTVMSGTPVLNLVSEALAGCSITAAKGILNGTTNFILTKMEEGMEYKDALKQAQKLGYAEADPKGDVEGYDTRAKVAILGNVLMNAGLKLNDIPCIGITDLKKGDILKAKKNNTRWKLIGLVENKNGKIHASVMPLMIPFEHPLAGIAGSTNALTLTTDLMGEVTIIGRGAGRIETGYSILTDLLAIHRHTKR